MGKKEFVVAILDLESETFIVHIVLFSSVATPSSSPLKLNIHPFRRPHISGLIVEMTPTKVSVKYSDFANIFSADLASKLLEYTRINNHAIKLVDDPQPLYRPIYRLRPMELKILKAYIKTNLANGFIRPSKLYACALILFNQKSDGFLLLCINYQGLNNLTIKNRYSLLLIGQSLDKFRKTK